MTRSSQAILWLLLVTIQIDAKQNPDATFAVACQAEFAKLLPVDLLLVSNLNHAVYNHGIATHLAASVP